MAFDVPRKTKKQLVKDREAFNQKERETKPIDVVQRSSEGFAIDFLFRIPTIFARTCSASICTLEVDVDAFSWLGGSCVRPRALVSAKL